MAATSLLGQQLDMSLFEKMKPRSIGPAGMSGRVTAIAVVRNNPSTIYLGSASGGLWKSTGGGIKWEPIFDTMAVASIGAVAVDQSNPDVVWVGTGEGNPRNSQTSGNGVHKSIDGGRTWRHLGLERTRNIHRVIIDPSNPDVVYIGAQGSAFGESADRGVFKTTDGGKTWNNVLHVDTKTGIADLVMDPSNPKKLIAAMWQFRRWPWIFKSGGPGSGLYVTYDGGASWKKRTDEDGLPKGELGRIGLAIAMSDPNRIYALVESQKNALYRSDDGGWKWKKVTDTNIGGRPFYYGEIHVDPANENRIYNVHTYVTISEDAGKTFETLLGWGNIHVDHHAFYIHPDNPNFIIDGNDGGAAISYDRGASWRFVDNLPLGQFYHISVDDQTPYNIYGGLQDNGSWKGPAYLFRPGSIANADWTMVGGGDGFDVLVDKSNQRYTYYMSQGGNLSRADLQAGENRFAQPVHPSGVQLRFNWNAGIAADPFSRTTIYYGSQFLHKSTDRGESWTIISPDLTTNDTSKQKQLESGGLTYDVTAAENHCTIIAVSPSAKQQGVIWVGTDDGNVQITTDAGKSWTSVAKNIKGTPESTWVAHLYASQYNAGEAFAVLDNHRRDDWTPYLYRTENYGRSWTRLADEKKVWGYTLSFAQDRLEPRLMFLGTEFGLHVSIDAGETWTKWKHFPTVSVTELIIHPKEDDLVIGTFGRAIWVLDDIRPLREIARSGVKVLTKPLHVFQPADAMIVNMSGTMPGTWFPGDGAFFGDNRPYGARISLAITPPDTSTKNNDKTPKDTTKFASDSASVYLVDSHGDTIRTFRQVVKKGINRFTWRLNQHTPRGPSQPKPKPETEELANMDALPGSYTLHVKYGKDVDSTRVNVTLDPRLPYTQSEIIANTENLREIFKRIKIATESADRLRKSKSTIDQISGLISERTDSTAKKVKDLGSAMQDSIKKINEMMFDREVQGIRRDPELLDAMLNNAIYHSGSSWYAPGESQRIATAQAVEKLKQVTQAINTFFEEDWTKYRTAVDTAKIEFFENYEAIKVE